MPFQVSPNIEDPKAFLKAETTKCWIRVVAACSQPIVQLCNKATSVILPAIKLPSQISPLCNDQTGIGQIMETHCAQWKNQEPFLIRRNIKSNVDESSTFLWNPNPIDCQTQRLSHSMESLRDLAGEVSQYMESQDFAGYIHGPNRFENMCDWSTTLVTRILLLHDSNSLWCLEEGKPLSKSTQALPLSTASTSLPAPQQQVNMAHSDKLSSQSLRQLASKP